MSADVDVDDPLLEWRKEFPALEGCVHLISHSLGAVPRKVGDHLAEYAALWARRSITAWEEWLPEVDRAAGRIERLLQAPAGTVTMNQNVSTIQAVLASCFDYAGGRDTVVYDELNFPSVSYVWKAEERRGAKIKIVPSDTAAIMAAIDERTLVVPISHVLFKTSGLLDAKRIAARAHEVG